MREIKLRAYIRRLKWMVQVERICFDIGTIEVDLTDGNGDTSEYYFEEIELMQNTGLKDKNGVEIYEGDIVKRSWSWEHNGKQYHGEQLGVIGYINPWKGYGVVNRIQKGRGSISEDIFSHDLSMTMKYEVIGNIYENPELLKESEQNDTEDES